MSLLQNSNAISTGGAYNLESSLRFRSSASAYLTRTPASAGNRKKYTISVWVKRAQLGAGGQIVQQRDDVNGSQQFALYFLAGDALRVLGQPGTGGSDILLDTTSVYRDTSSWYHIVLAMDTTQATASDRTKLYVNGEQVTSFSSTTYPTLNLDTAYNNTVRTLIGCQRPNSSATLNGFFDGYITEFNSVDGQALTPSDFGETDDTTGVWKPKKYTGTYGTNGFYLEGCRGTDQSGNGNDYTENNFNTTSLTPLSTAQNYDVMSDVPTLTDEDTANFPTYNVLFPLSTSTLQSGNQKLNNSGTSSWRHAISSIALPNTGKWYFEMVSGTDSNNGTMGIAPVESLANGSNAYVTDAILTNTPNASGTATGGLTGSTGPWTGTYNIDAYDALACAVDMDNNKVWFRIGSNWVDAGSGAGDPSAGTNPAVSGGINSNKTYHFVTSAYAQNHWVNFGQRPFQYTVPTGFKKLNTYNLPDSTIVDGSQYFDIDTWSGDSNATTQIPTPFSPDFVWIKNRSNTGGSGAASHMLYDTVRGVQKELQTNLTDAEGTLSTGLNSFDSDGYKPGTSTRTNSTGNSYVGWSWRGSDSSAVSNTDGTITSTVSANTDSGFSVITFTGNGTSGATIGHGLGAKPAMIIVKNRTYGVNWRVYHESLGATKFLSLNLTNAVGTSSLEWNNTEPTSSIITVGTSDNINRNGDNIVMYCFAEVEGFSKFGSYTGNGSTDGAFIYTGFRPAFVLLKCSSSTSNWTIFDTQRNTYNITNNRLQPNLSNAEDTPVEIDILSNGFKLRDTDLNNSGATFIYMAFAENPFKQSLAR